MNSLTWNEANQFCSLRNSELASLNTIDETNAVLNIVQRLRRGTSMYVGLRTSSVSLPKMYKSVLQWTDQGMAFDFKFSKLSPPKIPGCGKVAEGEVWTFTVIGCDERLLAQFACEFSPRETHSSLEAAATRNAERNGSVSFPEADMTQSELKLRLPATTTCPDGHVPHDFLSCDPATDCFAASVAGTCEAERGGVVPLFPCEDGVHTLAFTLVCDHQEDCADGSDEDGCVFQACEGFLCDNYQCIRASQLCDGMDHCLTGTDEERCPAVPSQSSSQVSRVVTAATVTLDGHGHYAITKRNRSNEQVRVLLASFPITVIKSSLLQAIVLDPLPSSSSFT